jgi:hypothetical protein
MEFLKTGRCLCGEITYQITHEPLFVHACHCTNCQKITGSSYWLSMFVLEGDFQLLQGKPEVVHPPQQYGVATKYFCASCACNIYGTHSYLKGLVLPATGTFDDTSWFKPEAHIFTRSKQPWVEIPDGTPAFEKRYNREDVWPKQSLQRLAAQMQK